MLAAVLIDVGGTLWPNAWPRQADDAVERLRRLRVAVPELTEAEGGELVDFLAGAEHPVADRQETAALVSHAVRRVRPGISIPPATIQAAMCLPAQGRVQPFPGARDLLAGLAGRGVRVVIASNALWRDGRTYRQDFQDFGLADSVAAYVSSVDVGWRKPHRTFFAVALAAADRAPEQCAMVGDSETNDIAPAHELGMLTIRIAIEESLSSATVATHVCTSLDQVAELLLTQADGAPQGLPRRAAQQGP